MKLIDGLPVKIVSANIQNTSSIPDIKHWPSLNKMNKTFITGIALCAIALFAWAETPVVNEAELVPSADQEETAQAIVYVIDNIHYRNKPLDDTLSSQILDIYIESLDTNRSFFTSEDLRQFEDYRFILDDALKTPDLEPAFAIFKLYRQRIEERVKFALANLDQSFAFSIDEEFEFDRTKSTWLDKQQLDDLWRKRVKNDYLNLKFTEKAEKEIRDILAKRYQRLQTNTFQYNSNDIFQLFANAYTTSIEPHTSYFSPRISENFDISMSLSLEGIGAVLRGETDYTEVQSVVPGGPADLGGKLHEQDKITGVGQDTDGDIVDVIGWRLDDVVDLIRGPKGTIVRLEVLPNESGTDGPSQIITITRDEIKLEEQAAKSEVIELENKQHIGVITVPTFYSDFAAQARGDADYRSTTRDVRKLLQSLRDENIDGIIIDLRNNGGGSLSEAVELTGLFIETGPIVQTKDSSGNIDVSRDPDPAIAYTGPLAVLVDRNSASASEIFAGAIQDYQRGVIIGEPTFGKGTVQNIVDLNRWFTLNSADHGRLKTTIAQFFRVSGGSNQHRGVIPDISFPTSRLNTSEHGERSLKNALPWDQIKPARFSKLKSQANRYDQARILHEQRIKTDHLFQLLMEEMELSFQANEKKNISLLESRRKLEREQLVTASKRLQNEFRLAQNLPPLDKDASDEEYAQIEPVDVLLKESARILGDLIQPVPPVVSPVTATIN